MRKKITPLMELELFERGIVIHRAWISPVEGYEYTVLPVGCITGHGHDIATRKSLSAAYNAARKHLSVVSCHRQT